MITSDGWSSRCESGNCVETRTRTVEGHEYVEVRDTAAPENCMVVPAEAWEAHEAALRAEGWRDAIKSLRDAQLVMEMTAKFLTDEKGDADVDPA